MLDKGVEEYRSAHAIDANILVSPSPQTREGYRMGGTPQTILLDPAGKVINSWMGAYADDTAEEVETALGITLPGLVEPPKAATAAAKAGA
jgi:hypothetical protein